MIDGIHEVLPSCIRPLHPFLFTSAQGCRVTGNDGRSYLDLTSGVGVAILGYNHPEVNQSICEQAARFSHSSFNTLPHEHYLRLAEVVLKTIFGELGRRKIFFVNSGAEAVENAAKIARWSTGRTDYLALEGAFHGRTFLGLALTEKEVYRKYLGPLGFSVHRVTLPGRMGSVGPEAEAEVDYYQEIDRCVRYPEKVAGFFLEPVQGEGGVYPLPSGFMTAAQEYCRKHGILLIADEIQSGFGRTGTWLACEQSGIDPDIVLLGKALGGGLPLAAVIGKADLMDSLHVGALGTTMGGNPVACAAGKKVIEIIQRDNLLQRASVIERRILDILSVVGDYPFVEDVRAIGAMAGIEFKSDEKPTGAETTHQVLELSRENGLLVIRGGRESNVIRLLPSLVIPDSELQEGLTILKDTIDMVYKNLTENESTYSEEV